MSQKTKMSSEEKDSKKPNDDSFFFENILNCCCGKFHEFKSIFKKEHYIIFECGEFKLREFNSLKDFHEKCSVCKKDIIIERDYYEKNKESTVFICKNCKEKDISDKKFNLITKKNIKEGNFRKSIKQKFINFIDNNGRQPENEFYSNNLSHIQLFSQFVIYLCFMRKLFSKENKIYKIISNFLEYSNELIDAATNNINIYDLYHFNKETIVYSYCNEKKKRFLSSNFKINYGELLAKCKKDKYLSIEMLKYVYRKYDEDKLVNNLEYDLMESKYIKKKEINSGKIVFLEASKLRLKYLEYKSILSDLEYDSEIINLKTELLKLEEVYKLDKYINSFLNIPGQFSIYRKSVSLILDKILKKNEAKLNFILPSETIINSTLYLISTILKKLNQCQKNKVVDSIKGKLKVLENILEKYKNSKIKRKEKGVLKSLNLPLINLEDEEKLFLSNNLKKEERTYTKISVANGEDRYLDFIIIYLFELKETTSKTIHVNDKENLKFYSFSHSKDSLPQNNKDDDLNDAIKKIKDIVDMVPKYEELSYEQLIDFALGLEKNTFFIMESKIDYFLTFLNLNIKKLADIKHKYKKIKKKMKIKINKITNSIVIMQEDSEHKRYDKFINICQIKSNSKEIFQYLDNIFNYVLCQMEEEKECDSDEESKGDIFDIYAIFKEKEKKLRDKISDIISKDQRFLGYFLNYLNVKLKEHVKENIKDLEDNLLKIKTNINEKNLHYLKLEKIRDIIISLKLYNFDIKSHFEEFIKEYEDIFPKKKLKIEENKGVDVSITNFDVFIKKVKTYIGDINEKVEITGEEPSQFVLKLFLQKIGLNWS